MGAGEEHRSRGEGVGDSPEFYPGGYNKKDMGQIIPLLKRHQDILNTFVYRTFNF